MTFGMLGPGDAQEAICLLWLLQSNGKESYQQMLMVLCERPICWVSLGKAQLDLTGFIQRASWAW